MGIESGYRYQRDGEMVRSAWFSPCGFYRYRLGRIWKSSPRPNLVQFVGLNPSTATEKEDDRTVSRCIRFARDWGFDGMIMSNIFAFRATDPEQMLAAWDPVGRVNNEFLIMDHHRCSLTVAAWGNHGLHRNRQQYVLDHLFSCGTSCLGVTAKKCPRHPLYVPANRETIIFSEPFERK